MAVTLPSSAQKGGTGSAVTSTVGSLSPSAEAVASSSASQSVTGSVTLTFSLRVKEVGMPLVLVHA